MKPKLLTALLIVAAIALPIMVLLPSCHTEPVYAVLAHRGGSIRDSFGLEIAREPATTPGSNEELWIISKPPPQNQPAPQRGGIPLLGDIPLLGRAFANVDTQDITDIPQCGTLVGLAPIPGSTKQQLIPIPLEHTEVSANIAAYIASVNVKQRFHNQYDTKIEAVYIFPLPQNAAITEFLMTIGDRTIRGIIREREEAERIYNAARAQGYVASLLTQERPNIFTQKVANIEPGKTIDIDITYFNTLTYNDGGYEFVFPMVVGPRFNPSTTTDGIGSAPRTAQGSSGQPTEITYLTPNERTGHDISLTLTIDAGVSIESITSTSHVITIDRPTPSQAIVTLSELDSIPNKDFVLRYTIAGDTPKTALLVHRDQRGGFFTLMIVPPAELKDLQRAPMEMIFVLDCSGSMSGQPLAQAKRAIERALRRLRPQDTFQIIRFSNNASQLGPAPLPVTPANIRRGLRYVRSLNSTGGTMMIEGIKAALDFPHDDQRIRTIAFLTDGYIGNESDILKAIHDRLGASHIFSFGVGSSPNRYLMSSMAKLGQGAVAYVGLNDSAAEVMDTYMDRISHPALRDIEINWPSSARVRDVYPQRIPDLLVGRPVILTGRFEGSMDTTLGLTARIGDETRSFTINTGSTTDSHPALASIWARNKIAALFDQSAWDPQPELAHDIKLVALEYGLMSAYTAFVAVDSLTRTDGEFGTTLAVPVPVPQGVRYDTSVTGTSK